VRLTLRVPLTLTIIPALTVSAGGQHYAIPRSAIEEIVRANGDRCGSSGRRLLRGHHPRQALPLVSLSDILGVEQRKPTNLPSRA
jgi:two-component system chemotaxis sensor kinase CheA